ncbi:MAG: PAS domain S-box protein [Phycisphaerae bacterium]|jgi:PAS domain S-box-containing protein
MKIANKISLSFLTVALIVMSVAGTFVYLIVKNDLQKSINNNLAVAAASRTNHIETYLEMLEMSVGQLSKSVVLEDFLKIKTKEDSRYDEAFQQAMRRLKKTREVNSSISEFMLLDAAGKVTASSNESSIGADKSADAYFLGGQKNIFIRDAYYSEIVKEPLIAVSAPFLDSHTGDLLGVLVARVKLNELNNIVTNSTGLGKTGEIYIVNKYGFMITPSRFIDDAVLKQRVDTENARRAHLHKGREHILSGKEIANVFPDYRGVQVMGAHEFIPQMKWGVCAEIEAKEAFAPLAKLRLLFFITLFIAVNAVWLSSISIARVISKPIHKLHKGTEIIGSGNLNHKVGTDAKDEIGQLSRAFDTMTENLKGKTTSIESLNKQIVQRKWAEQKLRESEEKYHNLFESSHDAIMVLDEKGFLSGNPATLKLFGCKDEKEFTSLTPADLSPEYQPDGTASSAKAQEMVKIAMEKDSHFFEWMHKRMDNTEFPATVLLTSTEINNKKVVQATVRDITESKKAEDGLRKLSLAVEQNPACIVITNPEGNIEYVNPKFVELTGYTSEEVIGKNPRILKSGQTPPEEYTRLWDTIKSGHKWQGEFCNKRKNGDIYFENASVSPVINDAGVITHFVANKEDITLRKKAEKEMQAVLEMKSKFISTASHELRTPLTSIKEAVNLVYSETTGPLNDDQKEFLGIAKRNVDRLARLINDVLDYQKMTAGRMDFNPKPANINEVVEAVEETMRPLAKEKGLELIIELDDAVPLVNFDKDKIIQVLTNLVSNAVKFTETGSVKITTSRTDDKVTIAVKDTGGGIKPEDMHKLFVEFQQLATKDADRKTGGTGLGLVISKKIIESHGGRIWVESDYEKGTTFYFELPMEKIPCQIES